ncbi:MAG: S8 family serine peptidase [Acidimicrobiia bacterium]|nr:S8 family serine peptidase [Acidimicrobiia bacterium]
MSRASLPFIALLLLALSVPPPDAAADDPLRIDSPRPEKSIAAGDFLGATHPDVEIAARPAGGAGGGFWAASGRASSRPGLLSGSAGDLRNLVESGVVGSLQRVVEMWDAGVVSEGVVGSEVEAWHGAGWTGRGMKIGVLDSSFTGYSALLGSELPATVAVASFHAEGLERGTNEHGTAVAEIIHDVAPGAELVLVNAGADRLSEAVDFFIAQDVDVINLSGGWSVGPFDGTAEQDVQANRAIDAGIVWVNAAGNEADQHFAGTYQDGDSNGWADLSGDIEINDFFVEPGDPFQIILNWTDPTEDLDLCLWDLDKILVLPPAQQVPEDCSEGLQNQPWHQPLEVIDWVNTYPDTRWFGFSIGEGSTLNPPDGEAYDVFTNMVLDLGIQTPQTSLLVPGATERVITVGAVRYDDLGTIEPFSSRGPTADGRVKPDLVGPDGVSTATYTGGFTGTSASSPFVAGLAALYLSMNPAMTPIDVRRELGQLADGAGKNNTFGWGYSRLGEPGGERVAFQDPGTGMWTLRRPDGTDSAYYYGLPSDDPMMCDWNGDGVDTPGLYRRTDGFMYLRDTNDFGVADVEFYYGIPEDLPVCGDWDGDGVDTVGIFRPGLARFFLSNANAEGPADEVFYFGTFGDLPFAGDWDGDGIDTVGLYRPSNGFVYITNENTTKFADVESFYGVSGDRFVVGDWDGDGDDTFGIFRASESMFYLANEIGQLVANQVLEFGSATSMPVAGTFE